VAFIHGRGFMLPGLDARLEGLVAGEKKTFNLSPEEAFGTLEQQQTRMLPRKEFPKGAALAAGTKFQAKLPPSNIQITLEVLEEHPDEVKVRLIHPYAAKTIICEIEVIAVRAATPKELKEGIAETIGRKAPTAPPPPPPANLDAIEELDIEPDKGE